MPVRYELIRVIDHPSDSRKKVIYLPMLSSGKKTFEDYFYEFFNQNVDPDVEKIGKAILKLAKKHNSRIVEFKELYCEARVSPNQLTRYLKPIEEFEV